MQANWTYIIIIICILLAAGLIWQEVRRANKSRLLWRVLAIIVAVVALACIALPITYPSKVDPKDQHKTVLLTAGFDIDSAAKYNLPVTFDVAVKKDYPKAQVITPDEISKADQLHIYGYGLNDFDLQQLADRSIVFHAKTNPAGVISVSYNSHLKAGDALTVQGTYNNTVAQKVKLVLKALNTGLDSVTIGPNSTAAFALTTHPKTNGRIVYTLTADDNTEGNLPVEVSALKPLKVLMLSAAPDFENKFLKNWLSENGYAVASRAAISKEKFTTEFVNVPQLPLDRLSASTLNRFDVVIGDLSVLNNLSNAESAALKQEVTDNGLGLIIRADSTAKSSWLQKGFQVDRPSGKETPPSTLLINSIKTLNKVSGGSSYLNYQNGTQPLVIGAQGHTLANSILSGSGKIVYTTLNNTFSWMLAGNKADYTSLWSALISKAARKSNDTRDDALTDGLPFVNQPVQVTLLNDKPSPVDINGEKAPAIQNADIPFQWNVLYRPNGFGWQNIRQNGRLNGVYVYAKSEWTAMQAIEKITATKKYEISHTKPDIVTKQIQETVRINVPKIYFYILLLAACAFLWVEAKIS